MVDTTVSVLLWTVWAKKPIRHPEHLLKHFFEASSK